MSGDRVWVDTINLLIIVFGSVVSLALVLLRHTARENNETERYRIEVMNNRKERERAATQEAFDRHVVGTCTHGNCCRPSPGGLIGEPHRPAVFGGAFPHLRIPRRQRPR